MNIGGFELNLADLATLLGVLATLGGQWHLRRHQKAKGGQIDEVAHEVKPNGGTSMRDVVDQIKATLNEVVEKVDANTTRIVEIEQRTARRRWRR